MECRPIKVIDGSRFIGEIINVGADEKILDADGNIDLVKFAPITYDPVSFGYYSLGEKAGQAFSDGKK